MKDKLRYMEHTLVSCLERALSEPSKADAKELGEVVDMIKDIEEALYYCAITDAMEEKEEGHYPSKYYKDPEMDNMDYYRDMDKMKGKMYYSDHRGNSMPTHREPADREYMMPAEGRDHREGRAPISRKGYMESKEMHLGKEKQMKDLEKYMMELTTDITEMIQGSSPEEKQLMQKKIATLAEKVGQVNV